MDKSGTMRKRVRVKHAVNIMASRHLHGNNELGHQ